MPGIVVHHTATSEESWDGPANVARLKSGEPAAYYAKAYAWRDPDGDATRKGSYRLPHHHVAEDGTPGAAVMAGCSGAIGALNGSRGGVHIPEADRKAAHAHLAAHMRDGGKEPPPLKNLADLRLIDVEEPAFAAAFRQQRAAAERGPERPPWYRIENAAADEAHLWIYNDISFWGTSAETFVADLQTITAGRITLHLNSPGGNVFDGVAIYNALRAHAATVTTRVEGIAASIASVIAMAGDRVLMAPHAHLMIHDPFALVIGTAADLRQEADVLEKLGDMIAAVYQEKAGGKRAEWRDRMADETWLSDQEAVDLGLADAIDEKAGTAATNSFDLSLFKRPPADLLAPVAPSPTDDAADDGAPTKRVAERALRDAGLSRRRALAVLDHGWADDEDDAERDAPVEPNVESLVATDPVGEDEQPDPTAGMAVPEEALTAAAARARELELYRLLTTA